MGEERADNEALAQAGWARLTYSGNRTAGHLQGAATWLCVSAHSSTRACTCTWCTHTHARSPMSHLPELSKSQGEEKRGSYLAGVSLNPSPRQLDRASPRMMGQGPPLEIRTSDFPAFDAPSPQLCPHSARHLFPCPSPNHDFSFHNPNHREVIGIRKLFECPPSYSRRLLCGGRHQHKERTPGFRLPVSDHYHLGRVTFLTSRMKADSGRSVPEHD